MTAHDDVIWKHFPRYWPFARGIHRSPVNSPHKGQWRGALMFSLIYIWINGWVNSRGAGDLRRYRAHYDVTVMKMSGSYSGLNLLMTPPRNPSTYPDSRRHACRAVFALDRTELLVLEWNQKPQLWNTNKSRTVDFYGKGDLDFDVECRVIWKFYV